MVVRDGVPILAVDQADAGAWTQHDTPSIKLMEVFTGAGRQVLTVALEVLRRIDVAA